MSWAAIAGGVASSLGTIFSNQSNAAQADKGRDFSDWQASKQMDFQKEMSNTAHTRQVADLKNAGLNPILAVNAGASSPSGAAGSSSIAQQENVIAPGISAAMEMTKLKQDIRRTNKEIEVMDSQKLKNEVDAKVNSRGIPKADIANRMYKLIEPAITKIEQATGASAKTPSQLRGQENGQKFFKLKPGFHKD